MRAFVGKKLHLLVAASIVALLALCVYFMVNAYEIYCSTVLDGELSRLLTVSRAAAGRMQMYLNSRLEELNHFVSGERTREEIIKATSGEESQFDALLTQRFYSAEDSEAMFLLDENGTIRHVRMREGALFFPEMCKPIQPEMRYFSGIFSVCGDVSTGYSLAISAPIFDEADRFHGCVVSVIPVQAMVRQVKDIRVGEACHLLIEDMDGTLLYSVDGTDAHLEGDTRQLLEYRAQKEFGKLLYSGALPGGAAEALNLIGFDRINVGAHHFFVSAAVGYGDAMADTQAGLARIMALFACAFLLATLFLLTFLAMYRSQRKARREADYLTDVNAALKQANESSRQNMQAEKMQAMGVYMSGIAHELNNMLTPVVAFSESLMRKRRDDPQIGEDVSEIYDGTLRIQCLIAQLLQFSRMERRGQTCEVHVADAVRKSVLLFQIAQTQRVKLVCDDLDPRLRITANWMTLHQCLTNLCKNAVQAMPEGGTITITADRWDGAAQKDILAWDECSGAKAYARITVRDTGLGMDEATMDRIFDPFFTTKANGSGVGLGLAVVRDAVYRCGGHVEVASERGKGSRFYMYFPLMAEGQTQERCAVDGTGKHTVRVLAVTANKKILGVLKRLPENISVQYEKTGADALGLLRRAPNAYHVVLADAQLGDLSGTTLIHRAKGVNANTRTALITLLRRSDLEAFHLDSVVDILIDPTCSVRTLRDLIGQLLEQEGEVTR